MINSTIDTEDLLDSFIWIEPLDSDSFFKVKETLTRMRSGEQKRRRCETDTLAKWAYPSQAWAICYCPLQTTLPIRWKIEANRLHSGRCREN